MQREKLYNLFKTAYFIVALFVFKMDRTMSDQILTLRKRDVFFGRRRIHFSLSHLFSICYVCFQKQNTQHDAA